ncbi:anthranilate phosphoribosyltransferase [Flexibacterium corallicola]|uniref:anthranilate phosphoribosyltransferase n=1 Tax=Flexibacterium corallicola TaxID=3037259 RepID=UPI00286EEB15|nr:anthranilate phosphoribosyltransferase [Pseudovibrio sp. M1P-2-3]
MSNLKALIAKVADAHLLSREEAQQAFEIIMSGQATPSQIGGFLIALKMRGETIDEIAAAVEIMRKKMLRVSAPIDAIDIVGTGGDNSGTYNVSTCTAFVVAGCGVMVAKHGNRSLSSKSGSSEALVELGININLGPQEISECINKAGIGFMFAPAHHSAMKYVAPTRTELGVRTIFNILGPLANPAGVSRQMTGVYDTKWVRPIADTLLKLGTKSAWVVHGSDGLDEITTTGSTRVAQIKDGAITEFEVHPRDAGLSMSSLAELKGGDPAYNAAALLDVLNGANNPYRDIVLFNAAAALIVAERVSNLKEGVELAAQSIDSGSALAHLQRIITVSQS